MYAKLKGAKFFLTIDLQSGYYHIALGKDSRSKTAFVMPFGKYKFLQVPFGLAQAPAFFQHLMNKVLDNCPFAMTYLDDIIIFSDTEEEHLAHIEEIFKRLEAAVQTSLFGNLLFAFLMEGFLPVSLSSEVCAGLGNGCERIAHRDLC